MSSLLFFRHNLGKYVHNHSRDANVITTTGIIALSIASWNKYAEQKNHKICSHPLFFQTKSFLKLIFQTLNPFPKISLRCTFLKKRIKGIIIRFFFSRRLSTTLDRRRLDIQS
mmetsp:Transcript_37164/g.55586  ORF Transcript_37164/g.55586 Transcript_37164/m.55586 type:complete len:113 (-) Transcript_37164:505-843(-)